METLRPVQEQEVLKFIQRLLDTPDDFHQHIRQTAGATLIKLTYGYDVKDRHDYFLNLAEEAVSMFSVVTTPGSFLVDTFPWRRLFLQWLAALQFILPIVMHIPWMSFKSKAKEWGKLVTDLRDKPAEYTRKQMEMGCSEPCLLGAWFERMEDPGAEKDEMRIKARAAIYGGGADTTVAAISSFFLQTAHRPEIQAAAHEEIDRVIGSDRLPTYSDRDSLPYIEALYKEVLRWNPVAPFGIPHQMQSDQDDVYNGMLIPRGSLVIPNIRAMTSNPNVYRQPELFRPERFLDAEVDAETNPESVVFGFGRR
ncbi:hypothetical protein FRC07_010644 [Ceratobasidium sp. 392]|nr:hypothetical protein FRC07_010644 [Ceratobasidium sp. 392]